MRYILLLTMILASSAFAVPDFDDTKAAAKQGGAYAQFNLALMFNSGIGVPENYTEAVKWYRKAAAQGLPIAQYNLGVMYVNGEGVPQDSISAYIWWSMAKAQGDTRAAGNIDILKPTMTKQQIAQAQTLATQCYESGYKDCY